MSEWIVRSAEASDRESWEAMYRGYCEFYSSDVAPGQPDIVWSWIEDGTIFALVLAPVGDPGSIVGFGHLRSFVRPIVAKVAGYLDDLFIAPEHRGSGASRAMFEEIRCFAERHDWERVRWTTRENNYRARGLYDQVAMRSEFLTYDMLLG